ncbi:unnamed protein product [Trichobilharzia szidati]|nr:unnamed protein product [Trichobilharzia szidati]
MSPNFTVSCVMKYVIYTCVMTVVSLVNALIIQQYFKEKFENTHIITLCLILGVVAVLLLIFVKKIGSIFPLNHALFLFVVLSWSSGLAATSELLKWSSLWAFLIAIFLAALLVLVGYKLKMLSDIVKMIIMLCAAAFILAASILSMVIVHMKEKDQEHLKDAPCLLFIIGLLLVLLLVGQYLKQCKVKQLSSSIYPLWLALITWFALVLLYMSIHVMLI